MDKNTELRSSLLYFVDEAIGYRHSVHFLHRWIETGSQSELEGLILEVGRENFVDLRPLIESIKDPANTAGLVTLQNFVQINGLYSFNDPAVKISAPPSVDNSQLENLAGNAWVMHNWVEQNTRNNTTPYFSIAKLYELIADARDDFYKIFDLLELMFGQGTTLFSAVKNNDIVLLGRLISQYYPRQATHINRLALSLSEHPDMNWKDALSRNQIKSKLWLIETVNQLGLLPSVSRTILADSTTVLLIGGWVGMLPFLADMKGYFLDTVINIDIDETVHTASRDLNSVTESSFRNSSSDARKFNVAKHNRPVVIDTIVEHFKDHGDWVRTLPRKAQVVLQGNDMFDVPDHVNCHKNLEEFVATCGLNNIVWSGELNLYKCTRYMVIGTT